MIINWDGKTYSLDFANLDIHEAEVIEKETGEPIEKWLDALGEGTKKLQFVKLLYWLMLAQNGEEVPVATVRFKLLPFMQAFQRAMAAEPVPAQEAPDPTQTAPPGPTSASPPDPLTPGTSPNGQEVPSPATAS